MVLAVDPNVLIAYYQAQAGLAGLSATGATGAAGSGGSAPTAPTAPWSSAATSSSVTTSSTGSSSSSTASTPNVNSLVQSLLSGQSLINPSAAKLDVSTSNPAANSDYKNLFALYQGLTALQTLASAANSKTTPSSELTQIQQAFSNGLGQVQTFLTGSPFKQFQVGDGTVTANDETTSGVPEQNNTYVTSLTAPDNNTVLAALQGTVQFSMAVKNLSGATTTVNFDLTQMGATPRTLSNVVSYLNSQLQAAGVVTRFKDQMSGGVSTPNTSGSGSTLTPTSWALAVVGSPLEQVTFSAPTTAPAVFIGQTSTAPAGLASTSSTSSASSSTSTTPQTASQLLNLDPTGANAQAPGDRVWSKNLPTGATVQSAVTGSDGSVYVLANVTGTINGQTIQGSQDVALLKYDTAGNLVYTRTLGAAQSASGYSLAVSADGTQVAVAGSVTGTLDPTDSLHTGSPTSQSFVTVYGTSTGDELWSQNLEGSGNNNVNAVAFGANNSVYVAGTTQSALPGQSSAGGQDAFIQGFTASSTTDPTTKDVTWTGAQSFTQEFGTSGVDRATGIAVNGTSVYVSSVENGDAVVREYDTSTPGQANLVATQDLGALQGGNLSGITVESNGSVVVAGSTHNGALNAGTVQNAYSSGQNAFVAQLSSNLSPASGESISYYAGGGDTTATALTVVNGQAYITGQVATGATGPTAVTEQGYAAAINLSTGAASWSQTFQGVNGNAAPDAIAVDATGASSLDSMGLPIGALSFGSSSTLVANSSVRPGDEFYVQVGSGARMAITVGANDTYATLAQKIEEATGYQVTASTTTDSNGAQELKIAPTSTSSTWQVYLEAGPTGRDALGSLGLKAGLVTNASPTTAVAKSGPGLPAPTNSLKQAYTINVPTTLTLDTPAHVQAALNQLKTAMAEVTSIYTDMTTPPTTATGPSSTADAALVNYYNSQSADYMSALERLTGGASSGGSTGDPILGLFA